MPVWSASAARHYNPRMTDTHSPRTSHRVIAAAVLTFASLVSGMALADDSSAHAQKGALPGVTGDYRIAKPAPQPEPDDAFPSNGNGTFKIGDTDVRISGSITVDIGHGRIQAPEVSSLRRGQLSPFAKKTAPPCLGQTDGAFLDLKSIFCRECTAGV